MNPWKIDLSTIQYQLKNPLTNFLEKEEPDPVNQSLCNVMFIGNAIIHATGIWNKLEKRYLDKKTL